ncbi:serine hydrolase domain-containing protein [Pseudoalteromonas umbrosa]|uniref:serine hydrolase domain-containing protein n=1 Tax=Pseudoalteromonas umbrosa TaxID=3048489 RepID=UPI0024C360B6|nr:serine hydrolase domain-containing protein [Pseudoalteromonas sp. B95]MDK1288224.1 serine hydrolase domain-containing protein [Pseudoalteromonas sp. B95]
MVSESFTSQLSEFIKNLNKQKGFKTSISIATATENYNFYADRDSVSFSKNGADILYPLSCAGKLFVSILVMQLIDEGKVSLNDRLIDIFDDLELSNKDYRDQIRVVNLLNYSTGIEPAHNESCFFDNPSAYIKNLKNHQHLFAPGVMFSYGEPGFVLAVRLVELLRGQSWVECLSQYILSPLCISIFVPRDRGKKNNDVGTCLVEDALEVNECQEGLSFTTGQDLFMRASELNRLGYALIECRNGSNGNVILSPESASLILGDSNKWCTVEGQRPGFGINRHYKNVCICEGMTDVSSLTLAVLPEYGISFVILFDGTDTVYNSAISRFISKTLLNENLFHVQNYVTPTCSTKDSDKFLGKYNGHGEEVDIFSENSRLHMYFKDRKYNLHYTRQFNLYLAMPEEIAGASEAMYVTFVSTNSKSNERFMLVNQSLSYLKAS